MTCPLAEPQQPGRCHWCGKKLAGRRTRWCSNKCRFTATNEHRWTNARHAIKGRLAHWRCEECGEFTQAIEVNHVVPCKGKHSVWGCWHHSSNLELLCHACHVAKTRLQRKQGLL